jgi:hypothetical protein
MRSKADIGNEKAQRWGTGLIGSNFKIDNGGHLSTGQSSCLYNIEHPPNKVQSAVGPKPKSKTAGRETAKGL